MKLAKNFVEKPWGRTDIPATFGNTGNNRIGEIWYETPDGLTSPILIKWLFTSEKLSIQVHPSDVQAKERGLISGKEECWYIVNAEPGAVLGIGTLRALSDDELRAASQSGEIEKLLNWKPVKAGDYFYIPAGTVHAIGAGIALVEVQQHADVTYRLYDYHRMDNGKLRELHLDDGVAVSNAEPYTDQRSGYVTENCRLVNGPFFDLWYFDNDDALAKISTEERCWLIPVEGTITVGAGRVSVGDCATVTANDYIDVSCSAKMLLACKFTNDQ